MKKRFDKRTAAISLSVVLALVLGVAAASSVPLFTQLPQGTTRITRDEPAEDSQGDDTAVAAPEADGITIDENGEYVTYVDEFPEQVEVEEAPAEDPTPQPFVMPEDATYEPEVALVKVDPSVSVEEVHAALSSVEGVLTTQISADALSSGLVRAELAEGTSVEDAVNGLMACGVVEYAQPNYIYTLDDLLESEEAETNADELGADEKDTTENTNEATQPDQAEETKTGDAGSGSPSVETGNPSAAPVAEDGQEGSADTVSDSDEASSSSGDETEKEALDEQTTEEESTAPVEPEASQPNDTYIGQQWGLASIRAYEAWDKVKVNGDVTVAVMDVGFNIDHEDLRGNILTSNGTNVTYNAAMDTVNDSVAPVHTSGTRDHGTHVAGIIAAESNNGKGISGATYNAKILPIMMFKSVNGQVYSTSESFGRAFTYIVNHKDAYKIRVVNISLGSDAKIGTDNTVSNGIKSCHDAGIVVVTSAGNLDSSHSSAYAHYPSDDANCVAVMSLARSGNSAVRLSTSNYNRSASDHKDMCAPGESIYSTLNGGGYGTMTGTSMATPFVSSAAALMFAANPKLTAQEAIDILHGTATDLGSSGWDLYYGYGEVNALAAVEAATHGLTNAQQAAANAQRTAQEQEHKQQEEAKRQQQQQLEQQQKQKRDTAAANSVTYRTHVQTYGWQAWKSAGAQAGTTGQSKRLEGIEIKLQGAPYSGGIQYRTHVQTYGWQGWKSNGAMSGTTGQSKRLEAIQIQLTGEMAKHYDVWYRVHAQTYGWLGWTSNGGRSGTATLAKRLEAIQVVIRPKGSGAPGTTARPYVTRSVRYRTHVQTYGWQDWSYDGATAGTTGQSKRLEAINISLPDPLCGGGIRYRTHVQTYGWQGWAYDGAMSGTSGQSKRLEAIQIQLHGEMANRYDVWYRVHAQTYGWMGWASNGASAGTAGMSKRLEAIQIVLRPKGSGAPGSTANAFRQR